MKTENLAIIVIAIAIVAIVAIMASCDVTNTREVTKRHLNGVTNTYVNDNYAIHPAKQ